MSAGRLSMALSGGPARWFPGTGIEWRLAQVLRLELGLGGRGLQMADLATPIFWAGTGVVLPRKPLTVRG